MRDELKEARKCFGTTTTKKILKLGKKNERWAGVCTVE